MEVDLDNQLLKRFLLAIILFQQSISRDRTLYDPDQVWMPFLTMIYQNQKRGVLVVLPTPYIRNILENYNTDGTYEFHWFTDPSPPKIDGSNVPEITTEFNAVDFVARAVEYVKKHKIETVIGYYDLPTFIAAIICEETGLRGPSIESSFLCCHKYYSRQAEPSDLWFEAIELDKDDWSTRIKYPCCVKAPCQFRSMCIFMVNNER